MLFKFIKTSLPFKWIIISLLISLSFNSFAEVTSKDLEVIHKMFQEQQKEKIKEAIGNVDKAIDTVIKLPDNERKKFAVYIALACKKHNLDPRIMISILKVESDFRQKAVSHTGDYSVAQINYNIWKNLFLKLDKAPLKFDRLKQDEAYAIYRMAEILAYYKELHEKKDKFWFARYHSSTPKFKNLYITKLKKELKKLIKFGPSMIKDLPDNETQVAQYYLNDR